MNETYREELKDEFGVYLVIEVQKEKDWLYADWIGYTDENRAKTGMLRYLEIMEKFKLTKLLNDNRHEHGSYPTGIETWIKDVWLGKAKKSNFKVGATIVSSKVFTRMSSEMLIRKMNGITYRNFEDEAEAKLWLLGFK